MRLIQGWTKVSLLDYPGHLCSVVFTAGCNLRCPYCHNKSLIDENESCHQIAWEEVVNWLSKNHKMIDGVCFTGGEPTLCVNLESMIYDVKRLDMMVKLDTNGTNPLVLKKLLDLHLIDFVAMDIKAPLDKYTQICRSNVDIFSIQKSVELIRIYAPNYEFRTTFHPSLLSIEDFHRICEWLKGIDIYVIQNCRVGNNLDPSFSELPQVDYEYIQDIANLCKSYFSKLILRGFTIPLQKTANSLQRV